MTGQRGRGAPAIAGGGILLIGSLLIGCSSADPESSLPMPSDRPPVVAAPNELVAEREGLVLEADLQATTTELIAEVVVRNERSEPVHLVPDPCGRVSEVMLVRTKLLPEGRRWNGAIQAVKEIVLRDQVARQGPDRFHPPRPPADAEPESFCPRPEAPIALAPGEQRFERWTLPRVYATALDDIGSEGSAVRVEIVEARSADELEFLNTLSWADGDGERAGRNVRIERSAAGLVRTLPRDPSVPASRGELFDVLVAESAELRAWIEEQPPGGWREVRLTPALPEFGAELAYVRFRLTTTGYERAATVRATPDGRPLELELPGPADVTRQFARRAATLPPGIALVPEPEAYDLTEDLLLPELLLPSGRIVVGEYLLDTEGLTVETSVPAGRHSVHATLAGDGDADLRVAFASLVVSDEPTVRWEEIGAIAVDGGSTAFISTEGRDALIDLFETDQAAWDRFWSEDLWDSHVAHDYLATERPVVDELNIAYFSSGFGDGGYPVFIGYDGQDGPTRIVADFYVVHLDWPIDP
jgi:hypothetical protein